MAITSIRERPFLPAGTRVLRTVTELRPSWPARTFPARRIVVGLFRDPRQKIPCLLKRRLEFQGLFQRRLSLLGVPGAQQRIG
jgi:hypothetical protein